MTRREGPSRKKVLVWCTIVGTGLLSAYLCFLAAVSLWIGFSHMEKPGFWMPILAGVLAILLAVLVYLRLAKRLLASLQDEDIVHL